MGTSTVSARLDQDTLKKLDSISKATQRSKSFLVAEAVQKYIDDQEWQIKAIEEGIKEADKGRFASDKEVRKFFSKRGIGAD